MIQIHLKVGEGEKHFNKSKTDMKDDQFRRKQAKTLDLCHVRIRTPIFLLYFVSFAL